MKHLFPCTTLLTLVAVLAATVAAQAEDLTSTALTATEIHGSGDWKTSGEAKRAPQRWNLDAVRFGKDSIGGRITVTDSPLLTAGNVEGKVSGSAVSGTIADDAGDVVITFRGNITQTGISGSYPERTGGVGEWLRGGEVPR